MKKVFVFNVHPDWDYCGGGACVIASDFNEARELLLADLKSDNDSDYEILAPGEQSKSPHDWNRFVCLEIIPIFNVEEISSRVVMCDYNYA